MSGLNCAFSPNRCTSSPGSSDKLLSNSLTAALRREADVGSGGTVKANETAITADCFFWSDAAKDASSSIVT